MQHWSNISGLVVLTETFKAQIFLIKNTSYNCVATRLLHFLKSLWIKMLRILYNGSISIQKEQRRLLERSWDVDPLLIQTLQIRMFVQADVSFIPATLQTITASPDLQVVMFSHYDLTTWPLVPAELPLNTRQVFLVRIVMPVNPLLSPPPPLVTVATSSNQQVKYGLFIYIWERYSKGNTVRFV